MSYIQENLMKDEKIIHEATTHWGIFISMRSLLTLGILPFLELKTNSFAITDKRIVMKAGILSVNLLDSNIKNIASISVEKPLLGRIFGFGTVQINGVGTNDGFKFVSNPDLFKKKFNEATVL